jgi:WD40 repeat protein
MNNCVLTDAKLECCEFTSTDLRNLKYDRYPDFIGHSDSIHSIAFSPDAKHLISASSDKTIKVWDV